MINSQAKGKLTELRVAKIIEEKFKTAPGVVRRTPMSGATVNFPGDLLIRDADSILAKWMWEVKNRKGGITKVLAWWKKAADEAGPKQKTVVVATMNNEGFYAFLKLDDFLQILKDLEAYEKQYG